LCQNERVEVMGEGYSPWNEEERQQRERSALVLWSEKTDELQAL
jgi:hypothetical protein